MKIFISWSGERSRTLALALHEWLPLVLHFAEPWLSTSDIKSGDRWGVEIAKKLQETNFGIICLTRDNLEAPWLLFESGALAKSMDDGRVIPLRLDLDVSEISGPLTQFQSERSDIEGVKKLVFSLNRVAANPIPDERLAQLFDPMWASLESKISAIPAHSTQKRLRPQPEILEELVSSVRNVELRVRDMVEDEPPSRRKMRRLVPPRMFYDMSLSISDGRNDPIQILIFASQFRDEMPWLYELGLDAYRALRSTNRTQAKTALLRFRRAIELLRRGPFMDMMGIDNKSVYMMLEDALHALPIFEIESEDFAEAKSRVKKDLT